MAARSMTHDRAVRSPALVLVLTAAACSAGGHPTARSTGHETPAATLTVSQHLCDDAIDRPVAASSMTSVAEVRAYETGGPPPSPGDRSRHPGRAAFPSLAPTSRAAWCTVGESGSYTFFAAGPDGTAVKIESVSGLSGPVPDRPFPIP